MEIKVCGKCFHLSDITTSYYINLFLKKEETFFLSYTQTQCYALCYVFVLCSVPSEFQGFRTMNIGKGMKGYSFISFSFQYKSTFIEGLERKKIERKLQEID